MSKTQVVWSVKRLAREYGLAPGRVGHVLRTLDAKRMSKGHYYYDSED